MGIDRWHKIGLKLTNLQTWDPDLSLTFCRNNKPGKNDDWYCRRCKKQKKEAEVWRPRAEDAALLEVIPAREGSSQSFRTLAQKKEYDSPLDERGSKKKSRPPVSAKKPQMARTPSKTPSRTPTPDNGKRMKESWVTGGSTIVQRPPNLPPGIVVGRSTEVSSPEPHQLQQKLAHLGGISMTSMRKDSEDSQSPVPPNLPPGISISRDSGLSRLPPGISVQKEEAPAPPRLPPGISLGPASRSSSPSTSRLPPGISVGVTREDFGSRLPPGISVGPERGGSVTPRLPPGISVGMTRAEELSGSEEEEAKNRSPRRAKGAISYQEPPLNKKMRQGDHFQTAVGANNFQGLSIEKKKDEFPRPNLPPGIVLSAAVEPNSRASTPLEKPDSPGMVDHDQESSDEDRADTPSLTKKKIELKRQRGKSPKSRPVSEPEQEYEQEPEQEPEQDSEPEQEPEIEQEPEPEDEPEPEEEAEHEEELELRLEPEPEESEPEEKETPAPPPRKKKGKGPKGRPTKPKANPEPQPESDSEQEPEKEKSQPPSEQPDSPPPEVRTSARGRSELARAKIRATLREDSEEEEENAGARVPYRKKGWKPITSADITQPGQVGSLINKEAWVSLGTLPSKLTSPEKPKNTQIKVKKKDKRLVKELFGEDEDETETFVIEPKPLQDETNVDDNDENENDEVETIVIEPKGKKKRGRKSKSPSKPKVRESSPEPASIDDLLEDDVEEDMVVPTKPPRGRKRKVKERESTDSEDAPLSQRKSGRRRSGRSDGPPDTPSPLPPSPVRGKPTAVVEPVRPEVEEVSLPPVCCGLVTV